ncbi:MAG TPA: hypothetical protein VFX28_16945, partial [Methylomirabilota bacterium]|nr:hypothetical protein [Methylomirabilota bacterium]
MTLCTKERAMLAPSLEPNCLSVEIQPGEARVAGTTIPRVPSAATMTVRVVNGGSLIRVKEVVVWRTFLRPITEEEIRELPFFPPSIREKARRNAKFEEREEVRRSAGAGSLPVEAGEIVDIAVEFSAPPQSPEAVTAAQLVVEGTTWASVQIPAFCVVGRSVATPKVEPARIRRALAPGETLTEAVVIPSAPTGDVLVACVVSGGGVIRLTQ